MIKLDFREHEIIRIGNIILTIEDGNILAKIPTYYRVSIMLKIKCTICGGVDIWRSKKASKLYCADCKASF